MMKAQKRCREGRAFVKIHSNSMKDDRQTQWYRKFWFMKNVLMLRVIKDGTRTREAVPWASWSSWPCFEQETGPKSSPSYLHNNSSSQESIWLGPWGWLLLINPLMFTYLQMPLGGTCSASEHLKHSIPIKELQNELFCNQHLSLEPPEVSNVFPGIVIPVQLRVVPVAFAGVGVFCFTLS